MRRIFPLLLILLLLCGCGGNRDAAAPEDADRLVIFTARSAAVYDDAVREFERRTGIWVEVHTADDALPLLEQIAAGQRCDLLLGVTPDCLSACGELFAPYAPEAAADIPGAYRDSEDRWTPFSLLPVVLIYNDQLEQPDILGVAGAHRLSRSHGIRHRLHGAGGHDTGAGRRSRAGAGRFRPLRRRCAAHGRGCGHRRGRRTLLRGRHH